MANLHNRIAVRDSKAPARATLSFTAAAFATSSTPSNRQSESVFAMLSAICSAGSSRIGSVQETSIVRAVSKPSGRTP